MSDSYQAIFDAARSRIPHCDTYDAISRAASDALGQTSHHMQCVAQEFIWAARELTRPSLTLRLVPFKDGNKWCVLYGDDLMTGISGFGDTPLKACHDFDKAYGWVG